MSTTEILSASKALEGFIKVWKVCPKTGESTLIVDKPNLILKGGAKLIAQALGGKPEAKIWGMYIGYNNNPSFNVMTDAPSIDVDYTNKFAVAPFDAPFGYLREPLTFTPSYQSSAGYEDNIVLFSTMVTSAAAAGGATFGAASRIYEVALVSAPNPASPVTDTVFSRTSFNPLQYDASYNFTITWGVRILLP